MNQMAPVVLSEILPQPIHKYEVSEDVIMQKQDEIERQEEEYLQKEELKQKDEDIEDQESRLAEQKAIYEELEKQKQSSVIKKGLPRPLQINQKYVKSALSTINSTSDIAEAERLILEELQDLLT